MNETFNLSLAIVLILSFFSPFFVVSISTAYSNDPSIYYRQTSTDEGNVKCVICYAKQDFLGGMVGV